jgi:hypothetical protein
MGNPKVAFGIHVSELDSDSQISIAEAVSIALKAGYEELVVTAHTYHPTDLAPLNIRKLHELLARKYPLRVSFAPEANIRPRYGLVRRKLAGVSLDLLGTYFDQEAHPVPLRAAILSLHFTRSLGFPKERDSETCPEQDVRVMLKMYRWALNEWERAHAKRLGCPAVIGHRFKYGQGDVGAEARARLDLRDEAERRGHWVEISIRSWALGGNPHVYTNTPVVLSFDAHNRSQFDPGKHQAVLADFLIGGAKRIFGE